MNRILCCACVAAAPKLPDDASPLLSREGRSHSDSRPAPPSSEADEQGWPSSGLLWGAGEDVVVHYEQPPPNKGVKQLPDASIPMAQSEADVRSLARLVDANTAFAHRQGWMTDNRRSARWVGAATPHLGVGGAVRDCRERRCPFQLIKLDALEAALRMKQAGLSAAIINIVPRGDMARVQMVLDDVAPGAHTRELLARTDLADAANFGSLRGEVTGGKMRGLARVHVVRNRNRENWHSFTELPVHLIPEYDGHNIFFFLDLLVTAAQRLEKQRDALVIALWVAQGADLGAVGEMAWWIHELASFYGLHYDNITLAVQMDDRVDPQTARDVWRLLATPRRARPRAPPEGLRAYLGLMPVRRVKMAVRSFVDACLGLG